MELLELDDALPVGPTTGAEVFEPWLNGPETVKLEELVPVNDAVIAVPLLEIGCECVCVATVPFSVQRLVKVV